MPELAYVNGTFYPLREARISVEDRGFLFADGVYEVVVFHGQRPLLLAEHLERLRDSCREISLQADLDALRLKDVMREGVRRAGFDATLVYLQLTRGTAPRSHVCPEGVPPTVVLTFSLKPQVSADQRARGIAVCTRFDDRWGRCHIKSIALLANVLAKTDAVRAGFDDAVFVGPSGELREATAANVFVIAGGYLLTPPRTSAILPGITRKWILDCARRIEVPIREQRVTLGDALAADEVFLSSTSIDLLSVVRIDERVIGSGAPGRLSRAIHAEMLRSMDAASECGA